MKQAFAHHLKTSRPGLWFATIWLYLLPTAGMDVWNNAVFWIGLLYFTFPFNYFLYNWNDLADREIDGLNPRKNSYLFGSIGIGGLRRQTFWVNLFVQVPFWLFFAGYTGYYIIWWLITLFFLTYLYNSPRIRLSGKPPWALFVSPVYLLAFVMSVQLNGVEGIPFLTYIYLILFCIQSQLIGEIMDIVPDREGGRKTTATALGFRYGKLLLALIVGFEAWLLLSQFGEQLLGGMLAVFAAYLVIDAFFIWKNQPYPVKMMKLFGICANIAAAGTMVWLWLTGSLVW